MTLAARAAALDWYHVLELAPGVVTRGWFDVRPVVERVPLPASLAGLRCLDCGTWDGFWAFELERRGAAAVVAIDVDDPAGWDWPVRRRESGLAFLAAHKRGGAGFELARAALGSAVERRDRSIYALDPAADGTFDLAVIGSLLMHLRDPVGALQAVRGVLRPGGALVVADGVEAIPSWLRPRTAVARLEAEDEPWWWQPNRAALEHMVRVAGFDVEVRSGVYFLPLGPAHPRPPLRQLPRGLLSARGRERVLTRLVGVPHAALRARRAG